MSQIRPVLRFVQALSISFASVLKGSFFKNSPLSVALWLAGTLAVFGDQSITLAWNPSTNTNTVGYNVYYGGASGVYTNTLSVGNATNAVIPGLTPGVTYYTTATAISSSGTESLFSNEIMFVAPQATGSTNVSALSTNVTVSAGKISFDVVGRTGDAYVVQSTSNMVNWISVQTNTAPFMFQDTVVTGPGCRFYRTVYLSGN